MAELTALGVDWEGAQIRRQRSFDVLEEFWSQHGHCDPKQQPDFKAHMHASNFRRARAAGELPDEWLARLDAIAFAWEPVRHNTPGKGDGRFSELLAFYRVHGHCLVPDVGKTRALYAWAEDQRRLQADGELRPALAQKLRELAFPLDAEGLAWERSFAGAAQLVWRGSKLPPPSNVLGAWLRGQLLLADQGELSPEREGRLRDLCDAPD